MTQGIVNPNGLNKIILTMKINLYKSFLCIAVALFTTISLLAQTSPPEGILYQAEARDNTGKLLTNKVLEVKLIIKQESPTTGSIVWEGEYTVTTDKYGLFTLIIGEGESSGYLFSDIEWALYEHFLTVQLMVDGIWETTGTLQFLSVPYAMHAGTASIALSVDESDPVWATDKQAYYTKNELQTEGSSQVNWSNLTNKPTTLDGFGITDGTTAAYVNSQIALLQDQIDALTNDLTLCDGKFVDLQTDPNNCGECGNSCGPDQTCVAGECVDINPSTFTIIGVNPTEFFNGIPNGAILEIEGLSQFNHPDFVSLISQVDGSIIYINLFNWEPTDPERLAFFIPMDLDIGTYNIQVRSSDGSTDELEDAIVISDQTNIILTSVDPIKTLTGPSYPITISCDPNYTPFSETPMVYVVPRSTFPIVVQLTNVIVIDNETITAVVPEGTNSGLYDIIVRTPEGDYGKLYSALTIMNL